MKRKLLIFILIALSAVCVAFGLTACDLSSCNGNNDNESGQTGGGTSDTSYSDGLEYVFSSATNAFTVTGIGTCTDTEIIIPAVYNDEPVIAIGDSAFRNCTSVTSVIISDGVTTIGRYAFSGCTSLKDITIPKSVTSVGTRVFDECEALENVYITDIAAWCNIFSNIDTFMITDYLSSTPLYYAENLYLNGELVTELTIPEEVTEIGMFSFYGCTSLSSVILGDNVTTISYEAFEFCTSLTSITLGKGLTAIYLSAFGGCYKLVEICNNSSLEITAGSGSYGSVGYYARHIYNSESGESHLLTIDDYLFVYDENNIYYLVKYNGAETEITLPMLTDNNNNAVNYHINKYAFYCNENLTKVTLSDNTTSIDDCAFAGCGSLTNISIPDNVTTIGYGAFASCTSLTGITIPDGVTVIDDCVFQFCESLSAITIPDGVTSIGEMAFVYCASLTSITIPDSVTSIGIQAFLNCLSLTDVIIGSGVTAFGDSAFSQCISLARVTISSGVTYIGPAAFYGCYSLTDIVIPDSVTYIDDLAFCGCTSLATVTIPDSVTSIGYWAFENCTSLATVTIPDNLTYIGYYAFHDTALYNDENNWESGALYLGNCLIAAKTSISGEYSVKEGTALIAEHAFYQCSSLTGITIPDSVAYIGDYAFSGCSSLAKVYISDLAAWCGISFGEDSANPMRYADNLYLDNAIISGEVTLADGITAIPYGTFKNSLITSITIPDGVTYIGGCAFQNCTSLKTINLPDSVTYVGGKAFQKCTALTRVYITDLDAWCKIDFTDTYANPMYYAEKLYLGGAIISGEVTLADDLTAIPYGTFKNSKITSIAIPDGVTSIGEYAFYNCISLTNITISESVTSIGDKAFENCYKLVEICNLSSLDLAAESKTFGQIAYYAKNIYNAENGESLIIIQDDYKFYNDNGAYYLLVYTGTDTCLTLPTLAINETDVNYSVYDYAFYNNYNLKSVTIPDTVTAIGDSAFYGCYKLLEVYNLSSISLTAGENENGYIAHYAKAVYSSTENESNIFSQDDFVFYNDGGTYYLIEYAGSEAAVELPALTINEATENYAIYNYAFYKKDNLTSISIPDSVTAIGYMAFYNCTSLESVTIPDSVTSIGSYAFSNCASLTSITIPDSVTSIGSYAFQNCTSLTSITIPDSVTSIGNDAFSNCTSLTSIIIPDSVTSISWYAFDGCAALDSVYYKGTAENWAEISIGSNNTYLTSATIYYYSENEPTGDGNYWHYVEGEIAVWAAE